MPLTGLTLPVRLYALCTWLLMSLTSHGTSAAEPYRVLWPSGRTPHPAVLLLTHPLIFIEA